MPNEISLENVVRRCGDLGRFQLIHFIFLNLVTIGSGITTFYYVFGVAEPSFRCRLPSNQFESINNNNTHPSLLLNTWQQSSKCNDLNGSICTDFVYDRRVFGRTFTEEANFVCRNAVKRTWLSTFYQIGGFVVSLSGFIGDKIGRQKMVRTLTVMLFVITLLTQILLQSITMSVNAKFGLLLINQLFSSIDAYPMTFLLLMELTSSSHTSLAGNLALIGFTLGEAIVTIFAHFARDWLLLKWIITGYFALVLPYLYFVPESPQWLFTKKKYNQLEVCLRKIATTNGHVNSHWYPHYVQLIQDPAIAIRSAKHAARTSKEKILRYLPRLGMCGFIGFVTMLLYIKISYGLGAMNDTVSPYWNIIIGAIVESIGYISASMVITTRLGRKYSLIIYALATSICVLTIPFIMKSYPILTTVISQIGKMTISGAVSISWIYIPEIFPTSMRGVANGVFVFVGRWGAVVAPIIDVGVGNDYMKFTSYVYSLLSLIMVGIIYVLPETRNRSFHTGEDEEDDETSEEVPTISGGKEKYGMIMTRTIPNALRNNRIDILRTKF